MLKTLVIVQFLMKWESDGFVISTIKIIWSEEEKFWYSKSMDERFGLTLESGSFDALIERVKIAVPELLDATGYKGNIDISFQVERVERLKTVAS